MMTENIQFILKRFPSFKTEITEAYAHNDEFKGLCEDIFTMTKTLERPPQSVFTNPNHELEYRRLLLELEGELLKFLANSKGSGDAGYSK